MWQRSKGRQFEKKQDGWVWLDLLDRKSVELARTRVCARRITYRKETYLSTKGTGERSLLHPRTVAHQTSSIPCMALSVLEKGTKIFPPWMFSLAHPLRSGYKRYTGWCILMETSQLNLYTYRKDEYDALILYFYFSSTHDARTIFNITLQRVL